MGKSNHSETAENLDKQKDTWLNEKRHSYYAQHGEDGIVEAILGKLNIDSPWMVEFGAWDGVYNSNVRHFLETSNASAVLIEGDQDRFKELNNNFSNNDRVYPIHSFVSPRGEGSLDNLLSGTPIPLDFDVLIVDVDGMDYHIWSGVKKYNPKIVVIEFNPTIHNDVDFVQEEDGKLNQGNSLRALVRLGKEKGYELVATTINNAFLVKEEFFADLDIANNSIDMLRTESHVSYIFNGYDGTIFIRGSKFIDLHNIYYDEKRMQIFPKMLRGYSIKNPVKRLFHSWYKSLWKRRIL